MRLALWRQHDFHFSQGLQKDIKMDALSLTNPIQDAQKTFQETLRKIAKKNESKNEADMEANWSPKGTKKQAKEPPEATHIRAFLATPPKSTKIGSKTFLRDLKMCQF